ncbi:hypothetical protein NDU88_005652 [Pleurodeles waltl]|uniref:Secreted protein n=1 Tax=Pleurodeles waltl TaxID=8319 RepID=A0AAV7UJK5_PLEWA|nr:hypothetical protein NDU88_005652 [Pleurodeles waltl]
MAMWAWLCVWLKRILESALPKASAIINKAVTSYPKDAATHIVIRWLPAWSGSRPANERSLDVKRTQSAFYADVCARVVSRSEVLRPTFNACASIGAQL